jgi:hypothetical protein
MTRRRHSSPLVSFQGMQKTALAKPPAPVINEASFLDVGLYLGHENFSI